MTNGVIGETQTVVLTGRSRVLVSGNFPSPTLVQIEIDGDSLDKATVRTFDKEGGFIAEAVNLDNLTATVLKGTRDTFVDISVTAIP